MTPCARRLALALVLPAALCAAAPAERPGAAGGGIWARLTGIFRKQPLPPPLPGHLTVGAAAAQRRAFRSTFAPPAAEAPLSWKDGKGGGKSFTLAEGKAFLEQAAADLKQLGAAAESGPWDKSLKTLDALNTRLTASVFPNREQRAEAQILASGLALLRHRIELRMAFARQNPRVTFIVWSPQGKSLAVVNRRVMREGDAVAPGVVLARIEQHQVVFALEGERIAVGLK